MLHIFLQEKFSQIAVLISPKQGKCCPLFAKFFFMHIDAVFSKLPVFLQDVFIQNIDVLGFQAQTEGMLPIFLQECFFLQSTSLVFRFKAGGNAAHFSPRILSSKSMS